MGNGQRSDASLSVPILCNFGAVAKAPESEEKIKEIKVDEKTKKADGDDSAADLEAKQRDAMINWLGKKLKGAEQRAAFEAFGAALLERYPKNLALQLLELDVLDDGKGDGKATIERADRIIAAQDIEEIAAFFGLKTGEKKGAEYEALLKTMKENKSGVVTALKAKVNALWRRMCRDGDGDGEVDVTVDAFWATPSEAEMAAFESEFAALSEWVDVKKLKAELFELRAWRFAHRGMVDKAMGLVEERIKEEQPTPQKLIKFKAELMRRKLPAQECAFLVAQMSNDLYKRFPAAYRIF